jgi:carboxyl-terminal processing protease
LQKSEVVQLKNQEEIKSMIVEAIIKRFQYEEGLYQYYLKTNSEIKNIYLLNNPTEYNTILKTNV